MGPIYEEGEYKIDCSAAVWSTNDIHKQYHYAGVKLKDVDWIIEDEEYIYMVEYKNALVSSAKKPGEFNPNKDQTRDKVVQKFYDSLH
jgi:hypothetical protein